MAKLLLIEPTSVISRNDRLLIALFVAIVAHALFFLITFEPPKPKPTQKDIEITLVTTKAKQPPKRARFLAQENNVGSGKKASKPKPPQQKLASISVTEKKALSKHAAPSKPGPVKQTVITQKTAEKTIVTAKKASKAPPAPKPQPHLSTESLRMQIAELGAKIAQEQHAEVESRIKFANSVSTHKYIAAQYISDWDHKVESIGNLNYPEIARKKNFSGRLTMDVGINADGSIYNIRIQKSSGYPALDKAAERIVRMSAPFPPLPKALLKELDVLVTTRVWSFSDKSGMTAH